MTTAPATTPAQGAEEIQTLVTSMSSSSAPGSPVSRRAPPAGPVPRPDLRHPGRPGQPRRNLVDPPVPGVRSDSDLFTYGYRFKPWRGQSIAAARRSSPTSTRLLTRRPRPVHPLPAPGHRGQLVHRDRRWTVEVTRGDTGQQLRFTTGFLWMCQGYYNHAKPYRPQWEGLDRFQGVVVHPSGGPRTSTWRASASS